MHAIQQHEFGPPENLVFEELPDPQPAEGQVRIAVEAAGIHLIDTWIRRGVNGGPLPNPELPMVPGREVAGSVDAVGAGVDDSWLGRRVVAHLGPASGGYAERALARIDAVHVLPDRLPAAVAVASIGTGRTAIGILDVAALTADDVVLVSAAAGGLGTLFVQAGLNAGALVVGAAGGARKVERVRELGAQVAVDYNDPGWPELVRGSLGESEPSIVLDGVGGALGRQALELLGVEGRLVLFGWASGEPTRLSTKDLLGRGLTATAIGPRYLRRPGGLRDLETRALAEAVAGRLVPVVGQSFPLAEAAAAHSALESRSTVGKAVLTP